METGHKKEFLDMIKRKGERVFDNLSDVVQNPERNLHKGQIVSFTNKYGVTFMGTMARSAPPSCSGSMSVHRTLPDIRSHSKEQTDSIITFLTITI